MFLETDWGKKKKVDADNCAEELYHEKRKKKKGGGKVWHFNRLYLMVPLWGVGDFAFDQ